MKRFLNNFVEKYNVILTIKNSNETININKQIIINTLISALIFSLGFLGIGYLLHTLENLYYVFFTTNTVIIGSFVIYKLSYESTYQQRYKTDYNVWISISKELIELVSVITLANTILFQVSFRNMIGSILIIALIYFNILSVIFHFYVPKYCDKAKDNRVQIMIHSIVIAGLYFTLFRLIGISNVKLAYSFVTLLIGFFYISKYLLSKLISYSPILDILLMLLLFLTLVLNGINYDNINTEEMRLDSSIVQTTYPLSNVITLDESQGNEELYYTKNYIYIVSDATINVYDNNFNLLTQKAYTDLYKYNSLSYSFDRNITVVDDSLYYIDDLSREVEDYEDNNFRIIGINPDLTLSQTPVYKVTDNNINFQSIENFRLVEIDDKFAVYTQTFSKNQKIYTSQNDQDFNLYDGSDYVKKVITAQDNYACFVKNGKNECLFNDFSISDNNHALYANERILVRDGSNFTTLTVEEYLSFANEKDGYIPKKYYSFYVDEDLQIKTSLLADKKNEINIEVALDKDLNLYGYDDVKLIDGDIFLRQYVDSHVTWYKLDTSATPVNSIKSYHPLFSNTFNVILLCFLIFSTSTKLKIKEVS